MSKLEFIAGDDHYDPTKKGLFKVEASKTKEFDNLSEAIIYYNSLQEDKALWDVTKIPELLESHRVVS